MTTENIHRIFKVQLKIDRKIKIFSLGQEKIFWSVPIYSSRFLRKETQSNATQSNVTVIADK